ncbi:putative polysaccharide export protein [Lojkania enalia]|uniref:Polysaccharide export protein n=1 Tax=Lojkania enalia TaxID=147567 RepID=A0A9P4NCS6_9PLEO|nr:putative polysaccharide export protein [Didymosphaeria enalia]
MRRRSLLRHPVLRYLLFFLFVWDSLRVLRIYSRQAEVTLHPTPPPRNQKRIYITCQLWNAESLLRIHWHNALLSLVEKLGVENVFVTIYESGSFDDTKGALRELDTALEGLHVQRQITLSDITHLDEISSQPTEHGWVKTPQGEVELRRIPYLADLRNKGLKPLEVMASEGQAFDIILFLNDIVFSPEDVLRLLDTNNGNYAAACSLDFSKPPYFYDTFALRDSNGHEAAMLTWPYFRSAKSRHAVEQFAPVPVASCWNGMVAMSAEPFLGKNPLRFRGISDALATSHLEGSECCLIHADNPFSAAKGVFLNPNVKVGYNGTAYDAIHSTSAEMNPISILSAIWQNRILRWTTTPMFKEWVVHNRVRKWKQGRSDNEPGEFCLVNEMQIIVENGWKHV